jgi:uncharacterized protein
MKLHQDIPSGFNRFTGYGEGYVMVNGERFASSLIVMPESPVMAWGVDDFSQLEPDHFSMLLDSSPEIVLLGTGQRQRFPHPKLYRSLIDAGIGVEVMDKDAACRTYNILMGEGRLVAAAIIL